MSAFHGTGDSMIVAREIYWNLGHWVTIPMYAVGALALGLLALGFWRLQRVWRSGRRLGRRDHPAARIAYFLRTTIDQSRVRRVRSGGLPHALFFWGFMALFVGTLLVMLQADLLEPLFDAQLLQGWFDCFFSLSMDAAGVAAIVGLALLAVRRFVIRPKGLETVFDDYLMHGLLFTILITGFVVEGARMAATEVRADSALAYWSPGGLLVAQTLKSVSVPALEILHQVMWWLHLGLAMGFVAVIPFTKFRHIFTTPFNYLLRPREGQDGIQALDLEDETVEEFGAAHVADLFWKDIYDADACTACARCQDFCPAWSTEKPLSPMKVVQQIGAVAACTPEASLPEVVSPDALWACTTCRACQEICPAEIEHVSKIIAMRRNLVMDLGELPSGAKLACRNIERNYNPWGIGWHERGSWAEKCGVNTAGSNGLGDYLYWVGCAGSFDDRNVQVARATAKVLKSAGVSVSVLGANERCCGDSVRRLGNEYLFQMLATENVATLNSLGVTRIVTHCPHCLNTLKNEYPAFGGHYEVVHHTILLAELIGQGRLNLRETAPALRVVFHDSCYLGRYQHEYAAPRKVLQSMAGVTLLEAQRNRGKSFCCGAGGGRMWMDEDIGRRINEARVEQLLAASPDLAPILFI